MSMHGFPDGPVEGRLEFRRSNAVVRVSLSGRDCCVRTTGEFDLSAAKRRQLLVSAAKAADQTLSAR